MRILSLAIAGLLATVASGSVHSQTISIPSAADFQVLPAPVEGPTSTPFLQSQVDTAWAFDREREQRWNAIRSPKQLLDEQQRLRTLLLQSIGGLPTQRTPLHALVTGTIHRTGFRVEKLIYQSLPGVYVTALVYVPEDGRQSHPAILVPAGHSTDGKIHYQSLCQRLVKSGYVVLSWDPIGQGERSQFWDAASHGSRYNLICAEHAVLGNQAYLAGQSLARYEVWDAMRGLDYLLSRSDVDRRRIAITGTSGGGFQTAIIAALDPRIGVVIPSCYIMAMPMRIGNRIFRDPDSDPEQDPPGFVSSGIDHAGLLLLLYPRPVLVAAATLDFFPIEGTRKTVDEVHAIYARFSHGDRVQMIESYNEHAYSVANQEAALRFLAAQWDTPIAPPSPVEDIPATQLICTHTGQVSTDFSDWTPVVELITKSNLPLRWTPERLRTFYQRTRTGNPAARLFVPDDGGATDKTNRWALAGTSKIGNIRVDRYTVRYARYFTMPLLIIQNSNKTMHRAVLSLKGEGKLAPDDWPSIEAHLKRGEAVVTFDYRAQGENAMPYRVQGDDPTLNPGSWQQEYGNPLSSVLADYTYNSIVLGRPYLLQKLEDIEIAMAFARVHMGVTDLHIEIADDDVMRWCAQAVFPNLVEGPVSSQLAGAYAAAEHSGHQRIDDLLPSTLIEMENLH